MSDRSIEERAEYPNGIKGEWEPLADDRQRIVDERDARGIVAKMNKEAKLQGSYLRYRSVPIDRD